MAKPGSITPPNRIDRWRKMWATPVRLDDEATDAAFERFQEAFVPRHMHKMFLKSFGVPKAAFGNRFFQEGATYRSWDTRLSGLATTSASHATVTVLYGLPDRLEATQLRGEMRRTLRDIVIDDWHAACAIVEAGTTLLYVFVEPKMRGCIVLTVRGDEEAPTMIEHDEDLES